MKQKIAFPITAVLVVGILVIAGLKTYHFSYATNSPTKAECSGNPITISATAPSSVTKGSTFSVTSVSSNSSVPNGITINKIVSTSSVVNATPAVVSGTWTGSGVGSFTALFPNVSLTSTGAAGSQIKMALSSIDLYVNGGSTPVTCSVANGQLTANAAGESLTVLTVGITAPVVPPPPPPPPSGGGTTGGGSTGSGSTTTAPSTPAKTPTTSVKTPTATVPTSTAASSPTPSHTAAVPTTTVTEQTTNQVTIVVKDNDAHVLKNAKVFIDSLPPEFTNSKGVATFKNVTAGNHKVTVWAKKKTAIRSFQLDAKTASPITLSVELPKQKLSALYIGGTATGSIIVILLAMLAAWRIHKRFSNIGELQPAYTVESPEQTSNIIISPAYIPGTNNDQTSLPPSISAPQVVTPSTPQLPLNNYSSPSLPAVPISIEPAQLQAQPEQSTIIVQPQASNIQQPTQLVNSQDVPVLTTNPQIEPTTPITTPPSVDQTSKF